MLKQKRLSLLIAAGLAVSLSAFPVFAEDAPAPPTGDTPAASHVRKPHQTLSERLDKMLKLTDAQKTTIHPILNDAETQMAAIRKDKAVNREDKKTQTLAILESLPDKLNPTLDAKQQAALAKYVERLKNPPARGERGKEHKKPAADAGAGQDQPAAGQDQPDAGMDD